MTDDTEAREVMERLTESLVLLRPDCPNGFRGRVEQAITEGLAARALIARLLSDLEAARKALEAAEGDAARYAWLKQHYYAADFFYPDVGSVLIFDMGSQERKVSANLDATIDAARQDSP